MFFKKIDWIEPAQQRVAVEQLPRHVDTLFDNAPHPAEVIESRVFTFDRPTAKRGAGSSPAASSKMRRNRGFLSAGFMITVLQTVNRERRALLPP